MALNSIIPINTKIQEVEQCDPVSSPSSTIDENKSVPDLSSYQNQFQILFSKNNNNINKYRKSMTPKIKHKNIFDKHKNKNNDSFCNDNLNIEKEKKIIEKYNTKKVYSYFSLKKK